VYLTSESTNLIDPISEQRMVSYAAICRTIVLRLHFEPVR